jgi:hypothetical protein
MKSRLSKRYYLIPALYIVLIALFVQLHVTGGGRITTEKVGPVQLWYKEAGGMGKGVEAARISLYGFTVNLSDGVEFRASDGSSQRVGIRSVATEEGSVEITLANGGVLTVSNGYPAGAGMFRFPQLFAPSADYRGVAFFYQAPQDGGEALPVLPFALQRTGELEIPHDSLPIAVARGDGESYICAGARSLQSEGNTLWASLPAGEGIPDVVISPYSGEELRRAWVLGDTRATSREEFAKAYASYLDTAYAGWKERYRSDSIGWRRSAGTEAAAEKIVTAFAAESLRRNGETGLGRFQAALDEGIAQESLLSTPFLDSVVEQDEASRSGERSRAAEISAAVDEGDPAFFADAPDLAPFLVWHGDQALIRSVDDFAATLAGENRLEADEAAGLFIFYSTAAAKYPSLFPDTTETGEAFLSLLMSHFVRRDNGLLYADSERVDVATGIALARSLIRYGEERDDPFAAQLGYTLADELLSRADEEGFLPARLLPGETDFKPGGEQLAPESIYPHISDNPFYPRVVSLAREIDPQIRLYTAAQAVGAVRNGNTVTITLDYEVGETEHVIVRGIGNFSNFFFYGLRWSSDRRFQNYAVGGWYYSDERDALYMKIRHQQKVERIMFDQ